MKSPRKRKWKAVWKVRTAKAVYKFGFFFGKAWHENVLHSYVHHLISLHISWSGNYKCYVKSKATSIQYRTVHASRKFESKWAYSLSCFIR